MSFAPNYKTYTLKELLNAQHNVCKEKHPKRSADIELAIFNKENGIIEEEVPETVEIDKHATFWPRCWATCVDGIMMSLFSAILIFSASKLGNGIETIFGYFDAVKFALYSVAFHTIYGQTLGKMALGVKVVDSVSEGRISLRQALLRDCVPITMIALLLVGSIFIEVIQLQEVPQWVIYSMMAFSISYFIWHLLEIITMLFNTKNRSLHDFIAGTVVIRT